jgi:hypothetical protein
VDKSATTRRHFLRALTCGVAIAFAPIGVAARPRRRPGFAGHPEPRHGVDGSLVLAADAVRTDLADTFDGIRSIPHIADGIGCHCGCGAMPEMRSLLSCYEGVGMAQFCVICEGEGRLAVELHAQGRSLDEIRAAIDRRFG